MSNKFCLYICDSLYENGKDFLDIQYWDKEIVELQLYEGILVKTWFSNQYRRKYYGSKSYHFPSLQEKSILHPQGEKFLGGVSSPFCLIFSLYPEHFDLFQKPLMLGRVKCLHFILNMGQNNPAQRSPLHILYI